MFCSNWWGTGYSISCSDACHANRDFYSWRRLTGRLDCWWWFCDDYILFKCPTNHNRDANSIRGGRRTSGG